MTWMNEQYPTRSDYYLMQVACEMHRAMGTLPKNTSAKDFKLEFKDPAIKAKGISKERATMFSQAAWFGRLGIKPKDVGAVSLKS